MTDHVDQSSERSEAIPIADHPDALTPEWLTTALRSNGHDVTVAAVEHTPVGTGQMGSSIRCAITYDGDAHGLPSSFVAKLPAGDAGRRAMIAGIHRAEVSFYRDLAPTLAVRTPRCYHAGLSDDACEFVLLLEDLAPAVQGDQIAGCSVAEARAGVVNLAGLHGPRWCDPTLVELDWMTTVDAEGADMVAAVTAGATETFLDVYGDRLSGQDVELLASLPPLLGGWMLARPERFGPLHGDYRLDNLMFGPGADDVAAVDWQTMTLGLPARDLAYFLSTSLLPSDRAAHERDLVADYHGELVRLGVSSSSVEQCFDDYRFGMLQGPLITIVGAAYGERTDRGDEMFLAMASRSCQAIRELEVLSLVAGG